MPYTLIISEKPAAAQKIAMALADGSVNKESSDGVPVYRLKRKSEEIVVASAVGHLYILEQKEKKQWSYPIFDIHWEEMSKVRKNSDYTAKYLKVLKSLAKGANKFVLATDLDVEGELIGLNVLRFACKQKDAHRMKFSTLTKPDLVKAFETKSPKIEWGLAKAGEARHYLDWYNGINYSRALTHAIKSTGGFKLMSTGRVQGPSLKIIVDREREIRAFKSEPYWELQMLCNMKNYSVEAWHRQGKFFDKEKAEAIYNKIKDEKTATVSDVRKTKITQNPPIPFDLTALQIEAYRCFKITPSATSKAAQELYTAGYISYPRTSSQELPESIGYEKIISDLSAQERYAKLCKELLSRKKLKPNNGKKTDPAHPAIFPTGIPAEAEGRAAKIYDLIVKRFFATFGDPAIRQKLSVMLDVKQEPFITEGTTTIEKGWHIFYEPYVKLEELELPAMERGESVLVNEINNLQKETQPPKRYTPASIVKELEKRNLGTKATRSEILETLYKRAYIKDKSIVATEIGIKTIEALEKYCPAILDEEMTRHFELEMEEIQQEKKEIDDVLNEGKGAVTEILKKFKKHEKEIGKDLMSAEKERRITENLIGKCPNCESGNIVIRKSKNGSFAGCNAYPNCRTLYPLPKNVKFKAAEKKCEKCSAPIISITKNNAHQDLCLNTNCVSRAQTITVQSEKVNTQCPKCMEGKLLLRNSLYGTFLGCTSYPKCKYIEQIPIKK